MTVSVSASNHRETVRRFGDASVLHELTSEPILAHAYAWLCNRRRDYPDSSDIWSFRSQWKTERRRIQAELRSGRYRFSLLTRIRHGDIIDLWSARDALVLKALAMVLGWHLPVSERCCHVKGHGGLKRAIREAAAELAENRFVMRTDVKSYYASIEHVALLDRLAAHIEDRNILNLIGQVLKRTSERGGNFWDFEKGIARGCPLSPLLGAFFLNELDARMEAQSVFYVRFMDDILVLAPTRWKLRRAVKAVNGVLEALGLEQHPDKTFIGRIERGFDFLGYHFSPAGLTLAKQTITNFLEKVSRLYDRKRQRAEERRRALEMYVKRWMGWAFGRFECAGAGEPKRSLVTLKDGLKTRKIIKESCRCWELDKNFSLSS